MSDDMFAIKPPSARRVKEVRHLPSGFDGYKHVPATQAEKRSVAYRLNPRGMKLYKRWKKTKNPLLLDLALRTFTAAAKADPDTRFPALKAASLSNVARILHAMDDTFGAMQQMREAIAISERHGITRHILNDYETLFDWMGPDAPDVFKRPVLQKIQHWRAARWGQPLHRDSLRVEQGEVGYSDHAPIGTDSVHDCVCVIVRNPATHMTALAHIDAIVDHASLRAVFNALSVGGPHDAPLEARLVGARHLKNKGRPRHVREYARKNLEDVIALLDERNIRILSADVGHPNQPTCVVVDPQSFAITAAIPDKRFENWALRDAFTMVRRRGSALTQCFDAANQTNAPVSIDYHEYFHLNKNVIGKSDSEVHDFLKQRGVSGDNVIAYTAYLRQVESAVVTACRPLGDTIEQRAAQLAEAGHTIDPAVIENAKGAAYRCFLYIGHGAGDANQPWLDFAGTNYLTVKPDTNAVDYDLSALWAFEKSFKNTQRQALVARPS